ncbi:hypothetical protein ACHAXT_011128 [Thalassiosira profunda]
MGIHEYLEARDISPADVGPFLFLHTLLSAVLVGSTWWACYIGGRSCSNEAMPSSLLLDSLVRIPGVSERAKQRACRTLLSLEKASRNSRPVQYLERKIPSLDATRLCVSYAEAKFGRLFPQTTHRAGADLAVVEGRQSLEADEEWLERRCTWNRKNRCKSNGNWSKEQRDISSRTQSNPSESGNNNPVNR